MFVGELAIDEEAFCTGSELGSSSIMISVIITGVPVSPRIYEGTTEMLALE